jgi:transposase InsO family protein
MSHRSPPPLDRNFTVAKPNQVWVGDITYIPTDEGWLFLAVVLDLFNRQVVGWSLGEDMRCELVIERLGDGLVPPPSGWPDRADFS